MSRRLKTAAATLVPVALIGGVAWVFKWPTAAVFIMLAIALGTAVVAVVIDA